MNFIDHVDGCKWLFINADAIVDIDLDYAIIVVENICIRVVCDNIDVVVHSTNGYKNAVIFEVRVYWPKANGTESIKKTRW